MLSHLLKRKEKEERVKKKIKKKKLIKQEEKRERKHVFILFFKIHLLSFLRYNCIHSVRNEESESEDVNTNSN